MGFSVPISLPLAPPYGLPPNVIRASYALNLIQTDAFVFATSRRQIAQFFLLNSLTAYPSVIATFAFTPLPTANGDLIIAGFGEAIDLTVTSLTSAVSANYVQPGFGAFSFTLSGVGSGLQDMEITIFDLGSGYLSTLFIFEASLTAGQLP